MVNKKNPFHDPIGIKTRDTSLFGKMPTKEEATTGRFMPMGADYGIGHTNPIGKDSASAANCPIPEKAMAFEPDRAIRGNYAPSSWNEPNKKR